MGKFHLSVDPSILLLKARRSSNVFGREMAASEGLEGPRMMEEGVKGGIMFPLRARQRDIH